MQPASFWAPVKEGASTVEDPKASLVSLAPGLLLEHNRHHQWMASAAITFQNNDEALLACYIT